nr:hypothetical protein [Tanacetum cinerariifolium]
MKGEGSNVNEIGGQDRAPPVHECTFSSFIKCNPTPFHGRALTWWNSQVATLGLNVAIGKSWGDMKKMMLEEFCSDEEVQRMEDELRSLKLRDTNIAAYTQRFHELVLLCPEAALTEKKKVESYIKGLLENIKEETTSSRPININEVVRDNRNNNHRGIYQDNTRHQQYNNKRQGNARALTNAPAEQGRYKGNKPLCNDCKRDHTCLILTILDKITDCYGLKLLDIIMKDRIIISSSGIHEGFYLRNFLPQLSQVRPDR